MDKFFYRLTVQSVIKAIVIVPLSLILSVAAYYIYMAILRPISATVDYWVCVGASVLVTAIFCFFAITLKDNYDYTDTFAFTVGKLWGKRVYSGKKMHWIFVELMMLPLLLLGAWLLYTVRLEHASVLLGFENAFMQGGSQKELEDLIFSKLGYLLKIVLGIFLVYQWAHVRKFAKEGRCPHCHAAFALGSEVSLGTTESKSSSTFKKARYDVVGANYQVTTEDGEEVGRTKISDVYEKSYDTYRTDTTTYTTGNICSCSFCRRQTRKYSSKSYSSTTKI